MIFQYVVFKEGRKRESKKSKIRVIEDDSSESNSDSLEKSSRGATDSIPNVEFQAPQGNFYTNTLLIFIHTRIHTLTLNLR